MGGNDTSTTVNGTINDGGTVDQTGGVLTKVGTGILTLTGTNTYSGGTNFNGGTVAVDNDSNLGTGALSFNGGTLEALAAGGGIDSGKTITLNARGGTFLADVGTTSTLSGSISGGGSFTLDGPGTLILTGTGTYTGGTTISAGTLQIGNGGTTGSFVGNVTDNGALVINLATPASLTISGTISGTGRFTQSGTGATTLTGTNTYTGGTTVTGGSLVLGTFSTTGSIVGAVSVLNGSSPTSGEETNFNIINADTSGITSITTIGNGAANSASTKFLFATTAGTAIISNSDAGTTTFLGEFGGPGSSAGSATISNSNDGGTFFDNSSTAANSTIVNQPGGVTEFLQTSTAASANITNNSLGFTEFFNSSTAGNATITTNSGGLTLFENSSTGGLATLVTNAGGTVDISGLSTGFTGMTAGSIAGAGTYALGSSPLTVGGNNTSTTVSGKIEDGGTFGGSGGALIKVGTGSLTLTGTNTYSGGTGFDEGTVAVNSDSNLGTGALTFNGGTLEALATGGGIVSSKAVTLDSGGGTFLADLGTVSNLSGAISGGGALILNGAGTLILSGANIYNGATDVESGTLQAGSTTGLSSNSAFNVTSLLDLNGFNNAIGSLSGTGSVTNSGSSAATLTAGSDNTSTTFSGAMADGSTASLGFTKAGTGTMILTGTNTYSGGTTIAGGTLQIGDGGTTGSIAGNVIDNAALVFDRSDSVTFAGTISGTGTLTQMGGATLILSGANTYSGNTNVNAGTLLVNGSLGTGLVTVVSAATLGGAGTIGGPVTIQNGGILAPGDAPGTLTTGTLTLNSGSISNYELRTPNVVGGGVNDLVIVNGNLTLAGLLNVTNAGGFGSGVYRLFNYSGSLTNNGLTLNTVPAGFTPADFLVQTSLAGQVNLLVSATGFANQYWDGPNTVADGTIHGGTGTWDNVTTNWTNADATVNAPWNKSVAIFEGTAGTVTLGDNIEFGGMVFKTTGYLIEAPGTQTLIAGPATTIDVGPGLTATISAPIVDGAVPASIALTDSGKLILTGANTYSGGTFLNAGTLAVNEDGNLGTGSLTFDGGTLEALGTGSGIVSNKAILLNTGGGTFLADADTSSTLSGSISGPGSFTMSGPGFLTLTGANSYTGGTTVDSGVLQLGNTTTTATIVGSVVVNGGLFGIVNANVSGVPMITTNSGGVTVFSLASTAGTVTLVTNDRGFTRFIDTSSGGEAQFITTAGGVVDISGLTSAGMTAGSIEGDGDYELGSKSLTAGLNNLSTTVSGVISDGGASGGTGGALFKVGTGTLTLSGANTYTGGTTIDGGTLQIGNGGTTGSIVGNVFDNAALIFDRSDTVTFSGTINGTGSLTQNGSGTLILTGTDTYTGGTTISAGILQLGNGGTTGSIVGNITDNSSLIFDRSDSVTFAGVISGTGTLAQNGSGTTTLSGPNTYTGNTNVTAGTLLVDGTLGPGLVTVASAATLGGTGTIGGPVTIQNGGILAPGDAPGTLTTGTLTLSSGSISDYQLGTPNVVGSGVNDLVIVNGNLTIAGLLNVANAGGFGSGVYRLFNYTGSLTNDGLRLNTVPVGFTPADFLVQTSVGGQVNLLVSASGFANQYWDGTNTVADGIIHGGSGTWDNVTTNWTNADATVNAPWNKSVAIFEGTAGTVSLGDNIEFGGMEFRTTGYVIEAPGAQTLIASPAATIDVGAGLTATISAPIVDGAIPASIALTDSGTLILTGANTYSGGTFLNAGILAVNGDGNLGTGSLTFDGGTLEALAAGGGIVSSKAILLNTGGGTFLADASTTSTLSGPIRGPGSFTLSGTGTLILTGTNSYTGGTTISEGTLQLGSTGTQGTIVGSVLNNATLQIVNENTSGITAITTDGGGVFLGAATFFFNGNSAGTAALTNTGGGVTIFDDTSTAGNATITNNSGGITEFAGSGTAGSATITTNTGSKTEFLDSSSGGQAELITNAGGIVDISGLTTGGTTVGSIAGAGTYQLGANALTTGSNNLSTTVSGTITDGGLSGGTGGSLIKVGTGTLTLTGVNTYSGGTTLDAGTVAVVNDSNLGAGALTFNGGTLEALAAGGGINSAKAVTLLLNGGRFLADAATSSTLSGTISGAGGLTKDGAGTLILTGNNIYAGGISIAAGTTVLAGTLQLGDGGATGSILTNVTDDAALAFDRSDSVTFAEAVIGTGSLTQQGTGTLILTGNDTYAGGTTIAAGTLQIGDGDTTGSIVGNVSDNGALAFDRPDSVNFGGVISGTGTLAQNGSGTLILSGANTYSGNTNVNAGILLVNGSLGSGLVTVASGAALGGTGTIAGAVTIQNGGILAPGDAPGTLTTGTLTLNSGSISDYELGTPNIVGSGVNDLVIVNGNLTLGGLLNVANAGGFGSGVYRLFNYSGSLTNNGLTLNTVPAGFTPADFLVQTNEPGEVNLLVSNTPFTAQYWNGPNTVADGTVHGGTGTWNNVTTNWTNANGTVTAPWQNGFAIFSGAAGTVSLASNIQFVGMQFLTTGYTITAPGAQTLIGVPATIFEVGPGLTATIAAPIVDGSSPTGIINADSGTLILTGTNTYTGGTTIIAGRLQMGDGGSTGSILGNVNDDGTLVFDRSDQITFPGKISGTGALIQSGAGTLILTGTNSYTGGTTITGGTLQLGTATVAGSIVGAVLNDSIFDIFSPNISGITTITTGAGGLTDFENGTSAGSATITNSGGTTSFFGASTAANAHITNDTFGATTFQDDSTAGNATIVSGLDGLTTFRNSSTAANASITNNGGSTVFEDTSQAGDAMITTNNGGRTAFVNSSTADNATITTNSGGLTEFEDSSTGSQARLITNAGGTVDISQLTSAGMTAGSIEGAGTYALGSKTLAVGLNNLSTVVSGTITDGGLAGGTGASLIKDGAGSLTLSGANSYSGGTVLNAGTLIVNNARALGLGNMVVNGGILRADPQPINVKENYTQTGGTLQLQVAGANPGQYDTLNVGGNASLGGTLQLLSLGFHPEAGNRLTLLTTGGVVTNRFAQFVDPFATGPGYNTVDLVYGLNSVVLEFLNITAPVPPSVVTIDFESFARTPNQRAAANILDNIQFNPAAASLMSFLYKQPVSELPGDLYLISPDALTSFYEISFSNANIQRLNLESRLDDVRAGSNGFSGNMNIHSVTVNLEGKAAVDGKASPVEQALQPEPENRWGVWVTGFGDFVNVDADYNAKAYNFTTGGFSVGIDYRLTDYLAIGAMGEYSHTWTNLTPTGDIDVDSGRGGVYLTLFSHGFYFDGAIYGGHNVYSSGRAALGGMANGGTSGAEFSTFAGAGYDWHVGKLTIGPIASLQYTYAGIDSFTEHGSLAPMAIHSQSAESLRTDLGFRASYNWQVGKVPVEPTLQVAWEHEYKYTDLPLIAGIAGDPSASDTFVGPNEGHDSAIISAGVTAYWTPTISTYIDYDGQLGRDRYNSNGVTGGVRISF